MMARSHRAIPGMVAALALSTATTQVAPAAQVQPLSPQTVPLPATPVPPAAALPLSPDPQVAPITTTGLRSFAARSRRNQWRNRACGNTDRSARAWVQHLRAARAISPTDRAGALPGCRCASLRAGARWQALPFAARCHGSCAREQSGSRDRALQSCVSGHGPA